MQTGVVRGNVDGDSGNDTIFNNGSVGLLDGDTDIAGHIYGGDGDDRIVNNGFVNGNIDGGAGNDLIEISGRVTANVSGGDDDDVVALYDGAEIGGIIDGGAGNDRLEFRFTTRDEAEYNAFAAQLAAASPAGGSLIFKGQSYAWLNFGQLVNLLQLVAQETEGDALVSVTIVFNDGRLNAVDVSAPAVVYCKAGDIEVWDVGADGQGSLAVSVSLSELQTGAMLSGLGNSVWLADGMVHLAGRGGYSFVFEAQLCL